MRHARARNFKTIPLALRFWFNGQTHKVRLLDGQAAGY
jgi:hypothetical protein